MSSPARLFLVLGCLVLAAIELPHGVALLADDLVGPYDGAGAATAVVAQEDGAFDASILDEVSALGDAPEAYDESAHAPFDDVGEHTARR
jgi:hypothetical protein